MEEYFNTSYVISQLAGYVKSFVPPQKNMVIFLLILSQVLFIYSLTKFVKYINLPFYPSYASFTFPFVITAIGVKMACGFFSTNSISLGFLPILAKFEAIFATIVCLYVLVRFVINFVKAK